MVNIAQLLVQALGIPQFNRPVVLPPQLKAPVAGILATGLPHQWQHPFFAALTRMTLNSLMQLFGGMAFQSRIMLAMGPC